MKIAPGFLALSLLLPLRYYSHFKPEEMYILPHLNRYLEINKYIIVLTL